MADGGITEQSADTQSESNGSITIMHLNVRGIRDKSDIVGARMRELDASVCMLCETHSYREDHSTAGFTWWPGPEKKHTVNHAATAGLAAFVCSELAAVTVECVPVMPRIQFVHSMWLRVGLDNGGSIVVGEVYAPNRNQGERSRVAMYEEIRLAVEHFRHHHTLIILGDFNARVGANGDSTRDTQGDELLRFVASQHLVLLNSTELCSGQYTRVELKAGKESASTIDYAIVPAEQLDRIHSVFIDESSQCSVRSDHRALLVRVRTDSRACQLRQPAAALNRRVWRVHRISEQACEQYSLAARVVTSACDKMFSVFDQHADDAEMSPSDRIEFKSTSLTAALSVAAEATIGSKRTAKRYAKSWWNGDCERTCRAYQTALSRLMELRQSGDEQSIARARIEANRTHRVFRRTYRAAKESDRLRRAACVEELEGDSKGWWYAVRGVCPGEPRAMPRMRLEDNTIAGNEMESLARLVRSVQTLAQPTVSAAYDDVFERVVLHEVGERCARDTSATTPDRSIGSAHVYSLDIPITTDEVKAAIKRIRYGTSAGVDGIPPELFRFAGDELASVMCPLFQYIFDHACCPQQWREGLLVPIYKKDGDRADPNNYRTIALLPVMSKVFEHVLLKRLVEWADGGRLLAEEQAGFRHGRCTMDQWFVLHEMVAARKQFNHATAMAFLDVRKAYDCTWQPGLWKSLMDSGCSSKVIDMLRELVEHSKRRVVAYSRTSEPITMECGVPQGAVLSPFLYSMFINGLVAELGKNPAFGVRMNPSDESSPRVVLLLYADDIVLLGDPQSLQAMLDVCSEYAKRWRFQFNASKSNVVVVGTRRIKQWASSQQWSLGAQLLAVVNEYKYLGLMFSSVSKRPCFLSAIDMLLDRAINASGMVMWQCGYGRGLGARAAMTLWRTRVQSILDYNAGLWGVFMSKKTADRAERIFTDFGRALLGCGPAAANTFVLGELGQYSQRARRDELAIRLWYRLECTPADRLVGQVYAYSKAEMVAGRGRYSWCKKMQEVSARYARTDLAAYLLSGLRVPDSKTTWNTLVRRVVREHDHTEWLRVASTNHASSLAVYLVGKQKPCLERYVSHRYYRAVRIMSQVRARTLPLMSQLARHYGLDSSVGTCCMCDNNVEESVHHFLLECPVLRPLKDQFVRTVHSRLSGWADSNLCVFETQMAVDSVEALVFAMGMIPCTCVSDRSWQRNTEAESVIWRTAINFVSMCWKRRTALCGSIQRQSSAAA